MVGIWDGARATAALLAIVAAGGEVARAQTAGTGAVTGRVTIETTGEPAHGATVLLAGLRRVTTAGEDGRFDIRDVPVGQWELVVEREHFSQARTMVAVTAGATATVAVTLSLAGVHEELTVTASPTGARTTFDAFSAVVSLDSDALARHRGATLADALDQQPGIAMRTFGAGSARPIIRGFDGDRVLVMEDGIRTGDLSSQSGDHGVTVDPAGLERLEVVKGPATLLYGSNAIGGVVNAVTPQDAFRASPFTGQVGSATFDAGSANAQVGTGAALQWGNGRWAVWGGGGSRRTGDVETPTGAIGNSGTRLSSGRAGAAWVGRTGFFSVAGQFEDGRYGIPFAGAFHHHEGDEEGGAGEADDDAAEVDISMARRAVRVDGGLRHLSGTLVENFKLTFSFTDYGHDEVEIAGGSEEVGTRFFNDTTTLRVEFEQARRGRLGGRFGIEWFGRDFEALGEEALAPATEQMSLAVFAYEELDLGRVRAQFGARIERNAFDTTMRASLDPEAHHDDEPVPPVARDRSFVGASGSFGIRADIGRGRALVANLSAASRAPALEELYNFGPHVGNLAFEIGNPDLSIERTVGFDLSFRSRTDHARAEFNLFAYGVEDFVFLQFSGDEIDGLREAHVSQADSRFVGAEAAGSFDLAGWIHLHAGLSYVRALLTGTGEPLPRIPPFGGRVELEIPWRQWTFRPEVEFTGAQRRVFSGETPTDGSARLNLAASYLLVRGHTTHALTLSALNVTNSTWRRHTSFIKDLAPEAGRGVRVAYTLRFF